MTLDQLRLGQRATVTACCFDSSRSCAAAQRLSEMGLVPGAAVRLVRRAPLGDPLEIEVGRFHLALRRADARAVTVAARPGNDPAEATRR